MAFQNEGFEHIGLRFLFGPHIAEFESKTKSRPITNYTGDAHPARGLELDLHHIARMQIDSAVEFHATPAYLRH